MGLQLKHREKDDKWRAWTTISDGWLTNWLTEDQMKVYLVSRREHQHKLDAIEVVMGFPHGYSDKDDGLRILNGPVSDFYDWHGEALKDYDTYEDEVDRKYEELIGALEGGEHGN